MDNFIKTTSKYSSMVCWVLPHEKIQIENEAKKQKITNILFIDSLNGLKKHISNSSLVYLSTTRATKYPNKAEISGLFNKYTNVQFCMGNYDCNYDPLEQNVFLEPLAGNFPNVYARMLMPHTAIEVFISGVFPDPWADLSPYSSRPSQDGIL